MKTPEEIKAGFRCCASNFSCTGCPYKPDKKCIKHMRDDILEYVEQLEERISLMLIQMRGDCGCCKHRESEGLGDHTICGKCLTDSEGKHPLWEYEGLPGDEVMRDG